MSSFGAIGAVQQGPVVISGVNFGKEVKNYSEGRKPYPFEVFQWIQGIVSRDANVLDMACGSGKATIDLRTYVTTHLTGFDIDGEMLAEAETESRARKLDDIRYVQGDARTIVKTETNQAGAFEQGTFDAITVCSAIHWMVQANAIDNLRQLLKPDGSLIIVSGRMGKDDTPGVILRRDEPKEIIAQALQKEVVYKDVDADAVLKSHGFEVVEKMDFPVVEDYTFEQACARIKSVSFFAELNAFDKEMAWPALQEAVKKKFLNGIDVSLRVERVVRCFLYKAV
jgi:SAM-dependent methyltransferase